MSFLPVTNLAYLTTVLIAVFTLDRVGRRVTLYCELGRFSADSRGRDRHVHCPDHCGHRRTLRHIDLA